MPLLILVAEDDTGTRLAIADYLERCGYSVVEAGNGKDALAKVDEYQPHLIVTDIAMPLMDGYDFVRRVRQRPALRLLPVIFLTAKTSTEERIRGYQLGCDLYLPKPFELAELGAVVRNLLDRYALIAQASPLPTHGETPISTVQAEASSQPHSLTTTEIATLNEDWGITPREQEALNLIVKGLSNAQIGDHLHLSPRTVEKYVSSLLRKTGTNKRAELVHFAMLHQLVQ